MLLPVSPNTNLPYCIAPRPIRMLLSLLGIITCLGGMTIGSIGIANQYKNLPFWLHKTILFLKKEGCITLILGSYLVGSLLTEAGKDPIHSEVQADKKSLSWRRLFEMVTRIPRIILSFLIDLLLLVPYGVALAVHRIKATLPSSSTQLKIDCKKPILVLIHGTNCNAGIWYFAKHHIEKYGNVIAIDLEKNGAVLNDFSKGIDHYAEQVVETILGLKSEEQEVIIIAHSMGGDVAMYVAEKLAKEKNIKIKSIFTIASPLQGSPWFDFFPNFIKPKRFHHMTENNQMLLDLIKKVRDNSAHTYHRYGSSTDILVPAPYTFVNGKNEHRYTWLGHLGIVLLPFVWKEKICPELHSICRPAN